MSAAIIAVLAVLLILVVAAVSAGAWIGLRGRGLRRRFGPEYDRLVAERSSRKLAASELAERERRVQGYQLRELSDPARKLYQAQWADVQELFVESPAEAIADGQVLVKAVMRERGYPAAEFDQTVDDLSVGHARALDHLRAAHDVSQKAASGQVPTEEIRRGLLHYREIFTELLGSSSVPGQSVPGQKPGRKTAAWAGGFHGDETHSTAPGSVAATSR